MKEMNIENCKISKDTRTFIIAELSGNHCHDMDLAKKTILAMKESGADAVKLQTYTADTMTFNSDKEHFQINHGTIWDGQNMFTLYNKAHTPWEWHKELQDYAEGLGLIFFSAPFDITAVDFLETLDIPVYKIASPEITDLELVEYVAKLGKPMIISTGIATLTEIQDAIDTCKKAGNNDLILLKCTSAYPTPLEDVNLRTMPHMGELFDVQVGLSDHTLGIATAVASIALGAKVVEKHFILSRDLDSPDKDFSLTPDEFKEMVDSIREVEKSLGKVTYDLTDGMIVGRSGMRTLFVNKDIKKGEVFTKENIITKRPGKGIAPKYKNIVLGKKAKYDLEEATPLSWDMVD